MKNLKTKWKDRSSKMNHKSFRDHTMLIWQPPSFLKDPSVQFLPMQLSPSAWWELSTSAVLVIVPEFTVFHRFWNAALPMYHLTTTSKVDLRKHCSILPLYRCPDTDICILMFKRKICKHYGTRSKWMASPAFDFTVQDSLTLLYVIEFRHILKRTLKNF